MYTNNYFQLDQPLKLSSYVAVISISMDQLIYGDEVTVAGWGKTGVSNYNNIWIINRKRM